MFPNQQNPGSPAQGQGPFGVPMVNGQPQLIAPSGQQQQTQNQQQPMHPQFQQQPAQVIQEQRHTIPLSALPQQQPGQAALTQPGALPQQQGSYPAQVPGAPGPNGTPPGQPALTQPPATGLAPNTVLSGPNVPPELQGRTWAEAVQIYNGMRDITLQNAQQRQAPQQVQTPALQQQTPAPAAGTPAPSFWSQPEAAIERIVNARLEQTLQPMLQPIVQQSQESAIHSAVQQVASENADFELLRPAILASVQGADPRMLTNQEFWRTALWVARGRAGLAAPPQQMNALPGQQNQQPVSNQQPQYWQQPPLPGNQPAPTGSYPPQQVAPQANPLPNLNSFYTEASGQGAPNAAQINLTPQQMYAADKMGMTYGDYAAWAGGMGRR